MYLEQIRKMVAFAKEAGCDKGIVLSGMSDPALPRARMRRNLEEALVGAVEIAGASGVTLLLEPLNTLVDHPGYYLDSSREGLEIVRAIRSPHLKLLFDIYHMQVMEGNLLATIEANLDVIGHFHSAGVPGRAELFGGEIDYPEIIRRLDALGYDGCFGLEYFPALDDPGESLRRNLEYLGEGTA
jgi:hydroxypyruvate isomerase